MCLNWNCLYEEVSRIREFLLVTGPICRAAVWQRIGVGYSCTYRANLFLLVNSARYLGLYLDSKLNWQDHIKKKSECMNCQLRKFQWLPGRYSKLSLAYKRLAYTTIFLPIWAYGLWTLGDYAKVQSRNNRKVP